METMTCQEAEKQLSRLIAQVNQGPERFRITAENGSAVLLSEKFYNDLVVTLEVLSTPRMMDVAKEY